MDLLKKILPKNKNLLLFGLIIIFVFLGVILPSPASAGPITNALLLLPGIFMAFFGFITNLLAQLSVLLFNWVTSPTFISWGYTQNPVIKLGLGITKQFVNMGLVVVLIVIALATALRIKEYASQKTLIRLIAVALLVNFAPVICGLIVDAANIVMNYFLSAIQTGVNQILGGLGKSFEMFSEMLNIGQPTAKQFGLFGRLGVFVIFNAIIGFTFILLAVIFLVRYLAIWVLVILAPLAFVAWILPATKKFWDQWWQQFLQWSIIGIPLAFFVYLAMNSFGAMEIEFRNKMPTPGLEEQLEMGVGYLNQYFGYMVVVVMIWLGIVIGLQTSAMGASGIMDFAKSKGKATVRGAGRKGWQLTKTGVEKARAKMPEGARKWAERWKAQRKWGEGEKGVGGFVKRTMATSVPVRYAMRGVGRLIAGKSIQTQQDEIKQYEKEMENKRAPELLADYHQAISDTRRIAALNTLVKKGEIDNIQDEKKHGGAAIKEDELKRIMKKSKKIESDRTIKTSLPYIAEEFVTNEEFTKAKEKDPRITSKLGLIISKMKSEDYGNMSEKALDLKTEKGVDVVDNILLMAMGKHISQLIDKHGHIAAKAIEERIDAGAAVNQRLESYLVSQAGRGLISPKRKPPWKPPTPPPPGGPPPTPSPSDTGEARKKKRKEPDVGNP